MHLPSFAVSQAQVVVAWLVFLTSYFVFAVGHLPGTKVDRPSMAVIGAFLVCSFRIVSPALAVQSIDFSTVVLLFCMMVIVAVLHLASFFEWITHIVIEHLSPVHLLPGVIFTAGVLSAFLVNDVVCLFMTPLVLRICHRVRRAPLPYLLGLAMASNIGSTATITGNPQNILIGSVSQIGYLDFLQHLGPVALAGLFIAWGVMHAAFARELRTETAAAVAEQQQIVAETRYGSGAPWFPMVVTIAVLVGFLGGMPPALAGAAGASLVLLAARQSPRKIFAEVDWALLVFFVGLFIITGATQQAGIARHLLLIAERWNLHNIGVFTIVVTLLSNIVSNVPAVMLLKDVVAEFPHQHTAWLVLAMASTLAGNLTITGSIANIIVIERAKPELHISFRQYLRVGVPVTIATLAVGVAWMLVRQ